MRRDKVLQYVQTFTEVRRDWRFDDRTVRFSHKTAHTGELANLRGRTTSAGVGHHVDGVERILTHGLALGVHNHLRAELRHHRASNVVTGSAPDVDHFVITLTLGHETRRILLLNFFNLSFSISDDAGLLWWNQHVVRTKRETSARCQTETRLHQFVSKDNGRTQATPTEARIDELRNFFLFQRLVDDRERQAFWQDVGEQRATHGGFFSLDDVNFFTIRAECDLANTHLDLGV